MRASGAERITGQRDRRTAPGIRGQAPAGDTSFAVLSELIPVGIVRSDADGFIQFANDTWSQLTGIPASEVIGKNWRTTIHPSDVWRIDSMRQTSESTELVTDARLRAANGRHKWMRIAVRQILDAAGNLAGRVTALTDVDTRKLLETAREQDRRSLAEQNVRLRDLDEARRRYLAICSHELRTPLTSIVSFAELIRIDSAELGPEVSEYLAVIQRNAERLLNTVGELLDLEGLEEGLAALEIGPVSIPDVTRESVRTSWSIARLDGIRLEMIADDGPELRGDSNRLLQLMNNLVANAVKFSGAGGRVEVRATHDAREWRIDVSDSGIGIPADEIDRLFDRFFRASNARREKVQGSGLGLPTAKIITELHGGRIDVASAVGSGTTFTVRLPIEKVGL